MNNQFEKQTATKFKIFYLLLAFLALSPGLLIYFNDNISTERHVVSYLGIIACVIPMWIGLKNRQIFLFPILYANGLFYLVNYFVHGFYESELRESSLSSSETVFESIQIVLIAILIQWAGFWMFSVVFKDVSGETVKIERFNEKILPIPVILALFKIATYLVPQIRDLPTFGNIVNFADTFSIGLFLYVYYSFKLSLVYKLFLFAYLMFQILVRITGGGVGLILEFVLIYSVIYLLIRRKVNFTILSLGTLFFFVFNPAKMEIRQEMVNKFGLNAQPTLTDKLEASYTGFIRYWTSPQASQKSLESSAIYRFNQLILFSAVVEATPAQVPYWNGETFAGGVVALIPRFLYPDKPNLNFANQFGRRYGILQQDDLVTSVNFGWVIDLYINYGYTSVCAGMFIFGMLLALIKKLFFYTGANLETRVLGSLIFFAYMFPEGNIVPTLTNFVINLLISSFIIRYLKSENSR